MKNYPNITEADLTEFKRAFGRNCARKARPARRRYIAEFGKRPERFTLDDLRHLAKPNRFARRFLGRFWNNLTTEEKRRVENAPEFAFVAAGEVVDWDAFYAERLRRLLE